jgi:hypothetical protein
MFGPERPGAPRLALPANQDEVVAFHVDYWDRLGWRDRWASPEFSDRQRAYAAWWGSRSIYTPGFVLDGKEWIDWPRPKEGPRSSGAGTIPSFSGGVSAMHEQGDDGRRGSACGVRGACVQAWGWRLFAAKTTDAGWRWPSFIRIQERGLERPIVRELGAFGRWSSREPRAI